VVFKTSSFGVQKQQKCRVDKRQRIHQQGVKSVDALALIHPTDRAGYLISKINHLCFNLVILFVT
jgi:hypothetical protein